MSTKRSTFGEVSFAAALVVGAVGYVSVSAQTTQQTRPRTLSSHNTYQLGKTTGALLQVTSPEAEAKAKRLYKTGVQYGNAGSFSQAAETFRRALALKPDYSDAHRGLGHAYLDLNQWELAIKSLEQALRLSPKDTDARSLLDEARFEVTRATSGGFRSLQPVVSPVASPLGMNVRSSTSSVLATNVSADDLSLTKIYRVAPGDVLDVILGSTPPANPIGLTITSPGLLVHPSLVEPLPVAGLTVEEISARFQRALRQQQSSPNTRVSVGVRSYVSHTIFVSGLVKEPGTKILRREAIPLSVVVADAQPLPEAGKVIVSRNEPRQSFTVDLSQNAEMNMLVHRGDVVTLQATPTQFFYVTGEVRAPGEKIFRRGLTLTQAIITAGGPKGRPKEARLSRDDGRGFLTVTPYKLNEIDSGKLMDPLIHPGDRITIINLRSR